MKRKINSKNIIKQILCFDLTSTSDDNEEQVRDQRLTYSDTIDEFTTFRAPEEQKAYMLDDTDYPSYLSFKKTLTEKKSKAKFKRPKKISGFSQNRKAKV